MTIVKRLAVITVVLLGCVGCDQATKSMASKLLRKTEMQSYFYDTIRLGYVENIGGFLSLGHTLPQETRFWVFTFLVGILLLGLFAYIVFSSNQGVLTVSGLSLTLGGGVSNFFDRVMHNGAVIDFINIGMGPLRTGVFNVADLAIMLGAAILIVAHYKYQGTG